MPALTDQRCLHTSSGLCSAPAEFMKRANSVCCGAGSRHGKPERASLCYISHTPSFSGGKRPLPPPTTAAPPQLQRHLCRPEPLSRDLVILGSFVILAAPLAVLFLAFLVGLPQPIQEGLCLRRGMGDQTSCQLTHKYSCPQAPRVEKQ
jgi:hypothetical protein